MRLFEPEPFHAGVRENRRRAARRMAAARTRMIARAPRLAGALRRNPAISGSRDATRRAACRSCW
nr:hypothetical protein [Burkholderia sp. MSMB617WGS]